MGLRRLTWNLLLLSIFLIANNVDSLVDQRLSLIGPYTIKEFNEIILQNWRMIDNAQFGIQSIELTHEEPHTHGAIWSINTVPFHDWEIQVQFNIRGKGVNLFGDGIAIWYTKDPIQSGPVFGSRDYFSGLGVFIDTFEEPGLGPHQHYHPYISAMVNNGSVQYSHGVEGTYMQLGGCFGNVRNQVHVTRLAVSYLNEALMIYVDIDGGGQWRLCFTSTEVHLPTGYHIGVSASSAESPDIHEVISITTINLAPNKEIDPKHAGIISHAKNYLQPTAYTKLRTEEFESNEIPPKQAEPPKQKTKPAKDKPEPKPHQEKQKPKPMPADDKPKPKPGATPEKTKTKSVPPEPKPKPAKDMPKTKPVDEVVKPPEQKIPKVPPMQETNENPPEEEKIEEISSSPGLSWKMITLLLVLCVALFVYGIRYYRRYSIRRQESLEKRLY